MGIWSDASHPFSPFPGNAEGTYRPMKLLVRSAVVLMALAGLSGCSLFKSNYVVPEMSSAQEQYALAYDAYRNAEAFYGKSDKKDAACEEAIEAFRAVGKNFPDDTEYRPLAELMLGRCELIRQNFKAAATAYEKALAHNPDSVPVQQVGLYELGVALDGQGKYEEAKEAYRTYIERYSEDPALKDDKDAQRRLSEARRKYRTIRSE